jgi:glucuronate isomerase
MPDSICAERVWNSCNERLKEDKFSTMGILKGFGVKVLSTSDDLLDDVTIHASVKGDIKVTPSLRADSILGFTSTLLEKLGFPKSLEEYLAAVNARLDAFSESGCKVADHALDDGWRFVLADFDTAAKLFAEGEFADVRLKSYVLGHLASQYAQRGWVMLLHIGAQRFTSSRLRTLAGPAGGYATIGNTIDVNSLCTFMDSQDIKGELPKTILFTLNPADNAALAVLTGSYSQDGVVGKVQFGPAWWYNDHFYGMTDQLENLAAYSLMPQFVGMTTDSRNVLSFSRHDYFRRILCNWIADKVMCGQFPNDEKYLGQIAANISYNNALKYFYE